LPGCIPCFFELRFKTSTFFKAGFHPNSEAAPVQKMRYSSVIFALAAPLLASAAPARFLGKRAAADVLVFREFLSTALDLFRI
jgi:hypothetical protein